MARKRKPGPGVKKEKVATARSIPEEAMPGQWDVAFADGYIRSRAGQVLSFTTIYVGDILRTAFWLLKKPLGLFTFVLLLVIALDFVVDRSRTVLSALCAIPVLPFSAICTHQPTTPLDVKPPRTADFAALVELQDGYNGIMAMNAGAGDIGLKLKQSEMATRDLVTLVGVSDLKNRDVLVKALLQFVEDARKAGDGLHRLSAKIDGAVDRITIANDYALRTIQSASNRDENPTSHLEPQAISVGHNTEDAVLSSFNDAMGVLARETQRTLLEASLNAANLERLQEHLITIHATCAREGILLNAAHEELLSEIWTVLGGNRQARRKNEMQLALLQAVDQYRTEAHLHVVLTREALQVIAADVEELRERVAAPEVVGERVPAEVMIRFIGQGIERLQEGRRRESETRQVLMNGVVNRRLVASGQSLSIES